MNYKKDTPGTTTATVYFTNNEKRKEICEAEVNADGTLRGVMLQGTYRKTEELANFNVHAIDFGLPMTLYLK